MIKRIVPWLPLWVWAAFLLFTPPQSTLSNVIGCGLALAGWYALDWWLYRSAKPVPRK